MKRNFLRILICTLLVTVLAIGPITASAASNLVIILKTTVEYGRLREGPASSYDVIGTLPQNAKVFWTGNKSAAFYQVRTTSGQVGYIYEGFLTPYGIVRADQIYYAASTTKVYRTPSTSSSRIGAIGANEHVLVFAVQGDWALIKTLSGNGGFVQTSTLRGIV